ncbi:MAG: hypothetical protein EZS28_015703 [Streblomastix strix]|uniref:Uncharacterized protein n=1 Tax=Streblomastix strix TaxID=222440 RepID=A0A5J4W247_9EUKA|nr:MAG: hypothetical protein EZS28_015703 [Streblomastix strix]
MTIFDERVTDKSGKFYRIKIQQRKGFKHIYYNDRLKDRTLQETSIFSHELREIASQFNNRTLIPRANASETAKDKQIFLTSGLQRRSSWMDSEEEEDLTKKALQYYSNFRTLCRSIPNLNLNKKNAKINELIASQIHNRDLWLQKINPQEEEDLDKQIHQLQEERDTKQLVYEQDAYDIVFGDIDCPADLNNNEMDKQSQSENSEEAKDHLSKQDGKMKHTKTDNQNQNENSAKAQVLLTKQKQKENYKEMDNQSQSDDFKKFEIIQVKKKRGRHKKGKKINAQQPRKERNHNYMIEVQTRNFISGTGLLQSKPEVKKERKSIPNKSNVLQDNHTSHLIQLKGELLTLKSICIGLNVVIRMSNQPTVHLMQLQLGRINFQFLLLWIRMERINRIENRQVRNFRLSTERSKTPKMEITYTKKQALSFSMYNASVQQQSMIHDQNLIITGNTFLNQQIIESLDFSGTLLQGVLIIQYGEEGFLMHQIKRRASSPCPNFGSYYSRGSICSALSRLLQKQETKRFSSTGTIGKTA